MNFRDYVLTLIEDDEIEEALKELQGKAETRINVLDISIRYAKLLRDFNHGLISPSDYSQSRTTIIKEIIDLVEHIRTSNPRENQNSVQQSNNHQRDNINYDPDGFYSVAPETNYEGLESVEKEALPADQRIVNTGFAPQATPQFPSPDDVTLVVGQPYFFWLEVGELLKDTIEVRPASLPTEHLPDEAVLEVALYAIGDGFQVDEATSIGKLQINKDGSVTVSQQPMQPFQVAVPLELAKKRLFFPLKTGAKEGKGLLKCNIYCQGILVQSREVRAEMAAQTKPMVAALASELQYSLSSTLTAKQLNAYREHKLSVLLSESNDNSHSFQVFGRQQYKKDASFNEGEIATALEQIRGALRLASWGKETEYQNEPYLYEPNSKNLKRLASNLFTLAKRGYGLYDALVSRFAGPGQVAQQNFDALMREPGYVQLVLQNGARQVLPLAVLYDHPLDAGVPSVESYQLCDNFVTALEKNQPLEKCSCFQGNCPHRDDLLVVCPSGFWGYRNYLGLPHSVKESPFAPAEIFYSNKPEAAVAVWNDSDFKYRESHVKSLMSHNQFNWKYADNRPATFTLLKYKQLSVVYFYCHGGLTGAVPYLMVGNDKNVIIVPSNLRAEKIFWEDTHPLVFINGCHTTALSPEQTLNFVSAFVENALCSGVIGTEITVFEPLAVAFSEAFFNRFTKNEPVGKAIRNARLDILQQYNPLGLVYIPFVISGLQLVKK